MKYTITNSITNALTKIERARGFFWGGEQSSQMNGSNECKRVRLFVKRTTHIEGTELTLDQSEKLLAGQTVPEANPDGNGRTARLLSTLCLYQAGYDFKRLTISVYYDRDRPGY